MIRKITAGLLFLFLLGCDSTPVVESSVSTHDKAAPLSPGYRVGIEITDFRTLPGIVTYHRMDKSGLEKAAGFIRDLCTAERPGKENFSPFVTCGPYLWPELANRSQFRDLKGPEADIPGTEMRSKYIMDDRAGALKVFLFLRNKLVRNKSIIIRTLTEEEVIIFWECISFDMEDPLFVIEGSNVKILIQLTRDNKVMYLDDFSGLSPGGGF